MKLYKDYTKEPFSLVDPVFRNVNRLFALLFKNDNDNATIDSLDKYYMRLVEIKDFNALIDNKPFFDQPVENKQEAYENLIEISRNNASTKMKFIRCFISSKLK